MDAAHGISQNTLKMTFGRCVSAQVLVTRLPPSCSTTSHIGQFLYLLSCFRFTDSHPTDQIINPVAHNPMSGSVKKPSSMAAVEETADGAKFTDDWRFPTHEVRESHWIRSMVD